MSYSSRFMRAGFTLRDTIVETISSVVGSDQKDSPHPEGIEECRVGKAMRAHLHDHAVEDGHALPRFATLQHVSVQAAKGPDQHQNRNRNAEQP